MADVVDSNNLVKHIANGSLSELCLVCLTPLEKNNCESIFTLVCKEETEYCVADALAAVCQFKLGDSENYNVCITCYKSATDAYKFHIQATRSMEIITHYTEELLNNVTNIEITDDDVEKLLCIPLSEYKPVISIFDFSLDGIGAINDLHNAAEDDDNGNECQIDRIENINKDEDNILLVVNKENESDSENNELSDSTHTSDDDVVVIVNEKKVRKKRDPLLYLTCSRCPVKYRFFAKLRDHVKTVHDVDLFYCKICKIITEQKLEYEEHIKQHRGEHQCSICNIVYKRAETVQAHMKLHEKQKESQPLENANICELCGALLADESSLEDHMRKAHLKRYTCYYCGRMYRVEGSFEAHLRRHEHYWRRKEGLKPEQVNKQADKQANKLDKSKRSVCQTCGKDFVDERSLLWHQRLHSNDRPYKCEVCGRGFVSVNRRNQHALCAHTQPQRRCPLCPALFHLRSMVNSHLKKVHLKAHKRRNRTPKYENVSWRTRVVPIQELSIDLQNDVMELQAARYQHTQADPENVDPTTIV